MRITHLVAAAALSTGLVFAGSANAAKVKLEPYVTGVNAPLAMVQPDGDDRKFVVEQFGRIRVINADGQLEATPFLDIRNLIVTQWSDFDERGLLGLAFHPDFSSNGKFYVAYSGHLDFDADLGKEFWWSHTNTVAEFTVSESDPNVANPNSLRVITAMDWPQFNHNGHWIGFGKDGMLYISTGDGGYANDWGIGHNVTEGNGQDLTTMLGKILRIDVNSSADGKNYAVPADNPFVGNADALPEIWAYGLRNPWRCSFDMGSDALMCGDVQQNSYEEIDIIEKGGNFGWRRREATHCFDYTAPDDHPAACDTAELIDPVLEYNNCTAKPDGCLGISVTGGYVYRGAQEAWDGKYIFGDWSKSFASMKGQVFIGSPGDDGTWEMEVAEVANMPGDVPYMLAFAQDNDGEVYALTSITTGPVGSLDTIYKIVPAE
ncbi:MAG: PQQ-dependent sugar dehydrogenase [Gammaproteobacteria bacterium]|nr:PQQ-dependent sugar dehydrogenase [Gammaproteobacteria bacterium]